MRRAQRRSVRARRFLVADLVLLFVTCCRLLVLHAFISQLPSCAPPR